MGFMDALRKLAKKWGDAIVSATSKVWNYMEKESGILVEKIPGWHAFKEKAAHATQVSVDWIWKESQEVIKEWKELIEKRKKLKEAETAFHKETEKPAEPSLAQQIQKGISENSK
jgi:hypothetical protein